MGRLTRLLQHARERPTIRSRVYQMSNSRVPPCPLKRGIIVAKSWTAAELALLGTDTDAAIAERIGRTRLIVQKRRVAAGIPAVPDQTGRKRPQITDAIIVMLSVAGYSDSEISEASGLQRSSVSAVTQHAADGPLLRRKLSNIPTERSMRIVAALLDRQSPSYIATLHGVSPQRVCQIKKSCEAAGLL